MTFKKYLALLPLAFATHISAEESSVKVNENGSVFHFSTQVSRSVEKDLMQAEVYSRKSGKNLAELKKTVSKNLNSVLELAKKSADIEISAEGLRNYADYDNKGKVIGWVAEGRIQLKSKNFEAIASMLESLNDEIAISSVDFSVSPEKMASLEDEMTLEIIKQFQHKANVIQKGLNAQHYVLSDIRLDTPNSSRQGYSSPRAVYAMATDSAPQLKSEAIPMEAGKEMISASASGKVKFH